MHNPLHNSWMIQPAVHFQRPARELTKQQGKMLTSSARWEEVFQRKIYRVLSCQSKAFMLSSTLPACRRVQTCNNSQLMTKKWMYLCAFQCRSQIGVVYFVSCWTAAAAGPQVDHAASAVCSSPSPVNVGPAAMDAYISQIRPLASKWKSHICRGSSVLQICSHISSQPPSGACS